MRFEGAHSIERLKTTTEKGANVTGIVRIFVAVTLLIVVPGCDRDDDDDDDGSSSVTNVPTTEFVPIEPTTTISPDQPCTDEYPLRMTVRTSVVEEFQYLDDVAACTSPAAAETLLVNGSDAVWTRFAGASVSYLVNSPEQFSFRGVVAELYPYAVLAPGAEVVVHAPPSVVEWTLEPGLTAAWIIHQQFTQELREVGQEQLTEMLAGPSLRRQALIRCSLTAFEVAGAAGELLDGPDPAAQLLAGLGITADVGECAAAWRQADEDALRRHRTTATWSDDVARWADNAQFLSFADTQLTRLNRLGKALAAVR